MKIEVRIEIDHSMCEAEVIDPHGNMEHFVDPEPEGLLAKVSEAVLDTYDACLLADEENEQNDSSENENG